MSLSRAFTTRRNKNASADATSDLPKRSLTKYGSQSTIRHKISAPIELLSTTNMLSYNAPDIFPSNASNSSGSSSHSGDDSDRSPSTFSSALSSPDTSSIESSSPTSPGPNHLSCYFGATSTTSDTEAPAVPKRAVSHTKSSSLQRSISRLSTRKNSVSTSRSSINMLTSNVAEAPEPQHPFGQELAQVSEVAEDFGISETKLAVVDEEEQELVTKGLFKFRADDYMSEIQGLFMSAFGDTKPTMSSMWI